MVKVFEFIEKVTHAKYIVIYSEFILCESYISTSTKWFNVYSAVYVMKYDIWWLML